MRSTLVGALFFAAIFLGSCASSPPVGGPAGAGVSMRIERIGVGELANRFGGSYVEGNPYLEPRSMLSGQKNENFVLRLTVRTSESVTIHVLGVVATDSTGNDVAKFYDRESLESYLDQWHSNWPSKVADVLEETYLPNPDFDARRGTSMYYLMLIGKKPIARPVALQVVLSVEDQQPQTFTVNVTGK